MNVAIVGYGGMGREIEFVLSKREHEVKIRIDAEGNGDTKLLSKKTLSGVDGIIEFALAPGILKRITIYAELGIPVVIGTTGWDNLIGAAKETYRNAKGPLLRGSNFSVGAHIFFRLCGHAAALINNADEYDVALTEYHHNKKADHPSGTALTAADKILSQLERKTHALTELPENTPIPQDALQMTSIRIGSTPGTHEMRMDSEADFITISHQARNRSGFALGAVRALEWLEGKNGWFEVEAYINTLLEGGK
ncbi:4-hydroxy-tetrahydrodipicolinate reductase [Olavius algarvensis spirochete endosymbiont]|nr:hypothetical protein JY97_04275 [Alkalispirochaeta odontotermitis]CAD7838884.1 MAG: hypothetical protein [Olavius algarvensis spirochete endosymbiont]VDB01286.1 4-hydroxy-tetrahydrodipicolinate reductase [Olavius algarvensis spirochete endosymbiont]